MAKTGGIPQISPKHAEQLDRATKLRDERVARIDAYAQAVLPGIVETTLRLPPSPVPRTKLIVDSTMENVIAILKRIDEDSWIEK